MVTEGAIWAALADVRDPEIPPVSIVDMGMVHRVTVAGPRVRVEIMPTFVGCPALEIIRRDAEDRLRAVPGVEEVEVAFVLDPPWSSDRITAEGRRRLRSFGIAPPPPGSAGAPLLPAPEEVPACPYCGSTDTHLENLFGPTACRSIYYCDGCRQPFERMKRV
ncbi:1,2-phenylacetyl-CoA epoxidase subunit PaaD [Symbiobacterium thermophilum]|uniref:Phenylacetic acid degradation protein n=2 Tax=Symbiobacterium thermophilum TaxID=2734 RepID=Q67LH8_SYMTH|nr:1,2-phenylacetyl-CoA epoxidase subunit PaaD [Symbiobacterium thermophilum]MBY6275715.1 phenylacetate-CoA oxygenase subunit PaaJ [Symbiobacterium thermophilum]BAD41468.1 phenylacetic acid degradation protein [Symbiobacterium thermophilum IAM 14863]